jgi:beta-lactamase class A
MLETTIKGMIEGSEGEVGVFYRDLGREDSLLLSADVRMHAASTMKVPVMIQLFMDREAGLLSLEDTVTVRTAFHSIVDGSPYTLAAESDSDTTLYSLSGEKVTYRHLIELMITVSSNLATNILIDEAGAERTTESMRRLGADSIVVLRGVEDGPAFRAGLSNTTTARDLGVIMSSLGRGEVVSPRASEQMLEIMSRQQWRSKIPAALPGGVRVAHKTGRISGISHDAGVVFPADAPPYSLVILTRGFEDGGAADALAAEVSRTIFEYHVGKY